MKAMSISGGVLLKRRATTLYVAHMAFFHFWITKIEKYRMRLRSHQTTRNKQRCRILLRIS